MEKEVNHKIGEETVKVQVSIIDEFEKCKEDMGSPFKHGKVVLHPSIKPEKHKQVVIKCTIDENNRLPIIRDAGLSGEGICHEVVDVFVRENWPQNELMQIETVFCNHYEMQYKYIIL